PEDLAARLEHGRDVLDRVAVRPYEVVCGDIRLADELGGESPLVPIPEHGCNGILAERTAAAGAVHDLKADLLEALEHPLPRLLLALSAVRLHLERLRARGRRADHVRSLRGDTLHVSAHAVRVLAVEDPFRRHRPERPDEARELLAAEAAEALFLLECLMVAEGAAAHADREPGR